MRLVKVGILATCIANLLIAATIRVPQDQPTIQAGIDAAVDGLLAGLPSEPSVEKAANVRPQGAVLFYDNFDSELNPLWSQFGNCTWDITNDYAHTSQVGHDLECDLIIENPQWTDYSFEYDVRGDAGVDKLVLFRYSNHESYYTFSIRSDWGGDEAYLHVPGIYYAQIVPFPSQNGVWYHVEIRCIGNHIVVNVDGTKVIDYVDTANSCPSGGIAINSWTGGPGVSDVSFDNVIVKTIYDGSTWHIDPNGDDSFGNGSESTPFASIQRGINAANDGDTVLVGSGVYVGLGNRDLSFNGKVLHVRGTHRDSVTIDCNASLSNRGRAISFESGEDSNCVFAKFTIKRGVAHVTPLETYAFGGAILCLGSSPSIENVIIDSCIADAGGAIAVREGGQPTIRNATIMRCLATWGGGVSIKYASARFEDCQFARNEANQPGSGGGAVDINSGSPRFDRCTFLANSSVYAGGAIVSYEASEPIIEHCTFVDNEAPFGSVLIVVLSGSYSPSLNHTAICFNRGSAPIVGYIAQDFADLLCCNVFGNEVGDYVDILTGLDGTNGNFSADPLFCDGASGDLRLFVNSPCAPSNSPCNEVIGALGVGCGLELGAITFPDEVCILHVVDAQPAVAWDIVDHDGEWQTAFEIAVGVDNDWQFAEMWNPAPFATADTFVVYAGAPLIDGQTYWLRLRVSNSLGWSNWAELMFRMNSLPSIPQLLAPLNGSIVTDSQPDLTIGTPSDAEGDSLFLTFEIASDSLFSSFVPFTAQPDADSLTQVGVPFFLTEDQRYWWRVKASDYFEESAYSATSSFWVDVSNSAPTAFALIAPANSFDPALATTEPILQWGESLDIDPLDDVSYAVHLALDSTFSFANIISGIDSTSWQPVTPLNWGTKYWWKVKATDLSTGVTWSDQVFRFRTMKPGDPDGNGLLTISDAVYLINYIFGGGPAPNPLLSGDADCNGIVTISDAVYLIQYIFGGGPAPCEAPI